MCTHSTVSIYLPIRLNNAHHGLGYQHRRLGCVHPCLRTPIERFPAVIQGMCFLQGRVTMQKWTVNTALQPVADQLKFEPKPNRQGLGRHEGPVVLDGYKSTTCGDD